MKPNKKFLMEFISCFGPSSSTSKRGSSSMKTAAHDPSPTFIEGGEENHESPISCGEDDLYFPAPAINHNKKQAAGKKMQLNRSNTIASTSSDHHHKQHYWRPSLSVISEYKSSTIAASVHRRSSSSPPPSSSPSLSGMKKLLTGKKHGASRRQHSTDSNDYLRNHPFTPVVPAFSPVAFMF